MKENSQVKPLTQNDLNNLEKLIKIIDPEKKVFVETNIVIKEKKRINIIDKKNN